MEFVRLKKSYRDWRYVAKAFDRFKSDYLLPFSEFSEFRNRFESMLRKYLCDYRMEQLLLPALTVSVDLVEGIPLLRSEGDATHNILESINLPPLALPLVRSQQAVVDGGLLNNGNDSRILSVVWSRWLCNSGSLRLIQA